MSRSLRKGENAEADPGLFASDALAYGKAEVTWTVSRLFGQMTLQSFTPESRVNRRLRGGRARLLESSYEIGS
jgi:hypothetical protein